MSKRVYQNVIITESVAGEDPYSAASFGTFKPDYALSEADYLRLKNGKSRFLDWVSKSYLLAIGYGVSLLAKWMTPTAEGRSQVVTNEWILLGSLLGVSIGFDLLCRRLFPNEHKTVMETIDTHFKNAPKSRQNIKRQK